LGEVVGLIARITVFVLVLLVAFIALAQLLRRTGMFFPDRFPTGRWDREAFAIVPAEHTFESADGVRLHAWWFSAKNAEAPVMIWFHGNAGNLTDRAEMAAEHAKHGISVFVFDYRGYGKSEGRPSERKLFLDATAAFDYVRGKGAKTIVLYGESLGGPYAAFIAKEHKSLVRAVILENTFPSLKDLGNALYRPIPFGWTAPFALRTTDWLNEAGVPVLVLHGTRDAVIPYELGRKLFDDLRVPKEMFTSHAGHCEIPLFEATRYYESVARFVLKEPA
jgi:fermentation-respiration switch protein FrsA (DUF1100 family)